MARKKAVQAKTVEDLDVKSSLNGDTNGVDRKAKTKRSPLKRKVKVEEETVAPKGKRRKLKVEDEEDEAIFSGDDEVVEKKAKKTRKTKGQKTAEAMPIATRTIGHKLFIGAHVSAAGG